MTTTNPTQAASRYAHLRAHPGRWLPLLAGAALGVALACQPASIFQCEADEDCSIGGIGGVCQSDGYCSFPSNDCDSGQQYGQYAPSGLAGTCVPAGDPGSTSSDPTDPMAEVSGPPASTTDSIPTLEDGTTGEEAESSTGIELTTGVDPTDGPPLDPDLVLWLTFDDVGDEVVYDQTDYDNDAYCYGACPDLVDGITGDSAYFDGDRTMLGVRFDDELYTPDAFTIAAWVRPERLTGEAMAITEIPLETELNPNWNSWELRLEADGDIPHSLFFATANYQGQSVIELSPTPFHPGDWIHLAGVWNGDTLQLFIDGREWETIEGYTPEFDRRDILIGGGAHYGELNDYFEGNIDDFRLYARALDDYEVEQLAESSL